MAQRYSNRDHLIGIAIYERDGSPIAITPALDSLLSGMPQELKSALSANREEGQFVRLHFKSLYVRAAPLHSLDNSVAGGIFVVHDTTYIRTAIFRIWGRVFLHIAIQMLVIVAITVLIVYWSLAGPIARAAQWMKALRTGRQDTAAILRTNWTSCSRWLVRWRPWQRVCARHVQRRKPKQAAKLK